jgi:hypothetical protein
MRCIAIAASAITLLLAIAESKPAMAQSGVCPAGTCSNSGGQRAQNVANCRASNCGKQKQTRCTGDKRRRMNLGRLAEC